MKQYVILADSITGIKGKQLLKGEVHADGEFTNAHISELVTNGFIKEYVDPSVIKKDKEAKNN